jgi:hypothetical protein
MYVMFLTSRGDYDTLPNIGARDAARGKYATTTAAADTFVSVKTALAEKRNPIVKINVEICTHSTTLLIYAKVFTGSSEMTPVFLRISERTNIYPRKGAHYVHIVVRVAVMLT